MSDDKMRAEFEKIYSVPPMTQWSVWHEEYVPALESMIDKARAYTSMFYAFCAGQKAAQRQGGEATAGMYGLSRSELLTIVDELRDAVLGMSDDDSPEAREEHLMDLTFHRYTQGDDGIQEGPFLCVNLSEYPEEGVYPIDQTGNAEARKTRVAQNAESDTQQGLSSVSDKQGGEAVAYCFVDVDEKPSELCHPPECASSEDSRTIMPLYTAPQPAVPEGWKLVPVELVEMLRETCRFHQEQGTVLMVQMNNLALLLDQADAERPKPPEDNTNE